MVDLSNVNKLEKVSFHAERAQVTRLQLNVICWLSKMRMENLNGTWEPVYGEVTTMMLHPLGQTPSK